MLPISTVSLAEISSCLSRKKFRCLLHRLLTDFDEPSRKRPGCPFWRMRHQAIRRAGAHYQRKHRNECAGREPVARQRGATERDALAARRSLQKKSKVHQFRAVGRLRPIEIRDVEPRHPMFQRGTQQGHGSKVGGFAHRPVSSQQRGCSQRRDAIEHQHRSTDDDRVAPANPDIGIRRRAIRVGCSEHNLEFQLGMHGRERFKARHDDLPRECWGRANAQSFLSLAMFLVQRHCGEQAQRTSHLIQVLDAGGCQCQRLSVAHEQLHAQQLLHGRYALGYGATGHAKFIRRPFESAVARSRLEG
ncbi:hypothetical protein BST28156_03999 [Burkholderia stagnalis]|nr:hypothetical protein BST28156_03999 [Burkholderia stagnalis]